ncbi:hypothetical protein JD844_006578 [Phrynosoma platyrhinos]|uniref:C2 domain-containing protein n=1 Tax=Phrynosoma platyrhinos TaxID=52577 RepID=A0ABQ7T1W7_PHRPL|nr:hypothetical protein JD844_006578 [Phrynosoma platyrhinos]
MDSDKTLEISTKRKTKKEKVQKGIARKMVLLEENARKKQTEDNVWGVSLRSKGALEQDPQKVATDVEQGIRLTEALRHRIRGKLKTIKGENSINLKGSCSSPHFLDYLRKNKSSSKYGNPAEQEDFFSENQDAHTEGYPNNLEENVQEAPVDEGLTFFTSTFEDHSKLEEVDPNVDQKSINDSLQNVCDLNEQTPLLHHVREILPELLEVRPAEYEHNSLNKEKQCDYLFVPSIFPVIHRSRLLNNTLPRNLEDEGFYVPRKPYISRNTYHKMENRLLQEEGGKDWFEENGELISLPSPIKQSHNCRVSFPIETDIQLRTTYRKNLQKEEGGSQWTNATQLNSPELSWINQSSQIMVVELDAILFVLLQLLANNSELDSCEAKISEDDEKAIFKSSKKPTLLARVYLPVPSNVILKSKDVLDEVEFSCEQQVKPLDGAVGSNIPFYLDENETEELCILTSGKVIYSLFWTVDDRGIPLAPTFQPAGCTSVSRNIRLGKGTGIWWHSDIKKCIDWAKEANIDPNDPDYMDLFELVMYAKSQEQSDSKYFHLEQLQEEFNFATAEDIKNCKRFQLLQLRSLGQLDFYCFQQIPLYDREIPDAVFQQYGSQLEKDTLMTDVDPISAQRNSSISFISVMRKQIRKRIVTIRHKYNLSDIVSDYEEIISMSQLSDAIFKLGERRRHLKPQRKERRKVPAQAISDGDVKLLIRILRAYNIPTRKVPEIKGAVAHSSSYLLNRMSRGRHIFSGNSAFTVDLLSEISVHPFVEVTFQNIVYQTSTADGSHPCWNEELQVDFTSPGHDYTFTGLSKIKDDININIFDEFVIEKHEDACPKSCSSHSYVRKNWLGSVTFPFSALLEQSKICGTFQVNTPPVLLGYTWSKTYVPPIEDCYGQNLKEYTFLTIFATIEPQLSSAENNLESNKLVDHEDETLLQRAYIFKQACKMMFPKRRIITSVFDNQGRNILVTKYITPLNPPQALLDMCPDDPNSASDLVSRFVSLIPCISDTVDENDDVDIWMTSEHCIKWGVCNKEEHAVLLCNYLLYIGKKAWVLLGTSVLEGKVAYVAAQENGYFFLWNPLSGQCYKQFDAFCPLQSVDCLINWENVWFNMQQNSSPMCVSFDISKECFWKQMLPISQDFKTQTVQPEKILYIPTDESLVEELQNRIEKTLKNKMMEWRSQHPTRWHRQCTSVLRQILPKLEFRNGHTTKEKEENYLETFHEHYWVTGFPIQMLYLDVQSITEAVYQTGIHSSEIPNTEFALAVYIHPYPNNMLSVWIYLVSLVRHQ